MSNRAHRRLRPRAHVVRCSALHDACPNRALVPGLRFEGVPLPPLCLDHADEVMAKLAVAEIEAGGDGIDGYRRWRERVGLEPMALSDRLAEVED